MIDLERAATALEGADRTGEAATAYSAILSKWPDTDAALMGLGNVSYADGEFAAAEIAFRKATAIWPERAEAWNNLAYVLAAQGQQSEAIVAANKAIDLAPVDQEPNLETLQDVSEI